MRLNNEKPGAPTHRLKMPQQTLQNLAAGELPVQKTLSSLATLPRLAVARVTEVLSHESDARLKAMGICSGRSVQVVQTGDPLIVRVLGTRVGLSSRLASQVIVEPVSGQIDSPPSQLLVSGPNAA